MTRLRCGWQHAVIGNDDDKNSKKLIGLEFYLAKQNFACVSCFFFFFSFLALLALPARCRCWGSLLIVDGHYHFRQEERDVWQTSSRTQIRWFHFSIFYTKSFQNSSQGIKSTRGGRGRFTTSSTSVDNNILINKLRAIVSGNLVKKNLPQP